MKRAQDPWHLHRTALAPLRDEAPTRLVENLLATFARDADAMFAFLQWHGLAALWLQPLMLAQLSNPDDREMVASLREKLRVLQRGAVAQQLAQERVMRALGEALEREGIVYVWLKAAAVRAALYDEPGFRSATDLDLLVHSSDRARAIAVLDACGATREARSSSLHEQTFRWGAVDIDLHWDVLAPGRLRPGASEAILSRRVRAPIGWRPDDHDCVALALVHPAFAKHVCTRHMGLNRVIDWVTMLRVWPIHPQEIYQRISAWGVFSGASASLFWLSKLNVSDGEAQLKRALNGRAVTLRQRWIELWIRRNWPEYWVDRSRLVLGLGFSLWLQDRPSDAIRAALARVRRVGPADAKGLG